MRTLGTVADPDLQIRGGGGGWEAGHPDLEKRGAQSQRNFSRPFEPHFGLKIRQGGPPGPSLGAATGEKGRECLL